MNITGILLLVSCLQLLHILHSRLFKTLAQKFTEAYLVHKFSIMELEGSPPCSQIPLFILCSQGQANSNTLISLFLRFTLPLSVHVIMVTMMVIKPNMKVLLILITQMPIPPAFRYHKTVHFCIQAHCV